MGCNAPFLPARSSSRTTSGVLSYPSPYNTALYSIGLLRLEEYRGQLGGRYLPPIWVRLVSRTMHIRSTLSALSSDGAIPHAEIALWNVAPNQPYDISLHLVVPANEANVALGNFMASLTIVGSSNNTIAETRKPVSGLRCLYLHRILRRHSTRRLFYHSILRHGLTCIIGRVPSTLTYLC